MLIQQKGQQWGPANNHPKQTAAARIEKKPILAMSRQAIDPASLEDASDSDVSTYNPDPRNPGVDPKVYLTNPVQPPPANPETKEAIEAIQGITATIEEVSTIATTIGSAIEEQGAATAEIARNVTQTAQATQDVTTNIGGVSAAANETGGAAGLVLTAASNLSKQAEQLSGEVTTFLAGVRAA